MSDNNEAKIKEYNVKLYPIYKMVSWDLLFYYSIVFLFLIQAKGLTAAEVLLCDSFYPLFKALFQIPAISVVDRIGRRNGVVLGNIILALAILNLLSFPGIIAGILLNIFIAAGFTLKGLCETSLLDECIEDSPKKRSKFSSTDGRGNSLWYFFDAISSITTGFLFVINPYYPITVCLVFCILSSFISLKFKPYEKISKRKITGLTDVKKRLKGINSAFKFIFKSNRLRSLIVFSALFHGILGIRSTMTSSILTDMAVPEQYFGVISAVLCIFASIASKHQNFFQHHFKNRTLTAFSVPYCISLLVIGFVSILNFRFDFTLIVILIMFAIQNIIKGPYYTLIYRYLNSFSTPEISTKIYSAAALAEGVFRFGITIFASFLLDFVSTSYAYIIIGCVFLIIFNVLLDYMKTRVGLKPEEYNKSDIEYKFVE